ncbi:hypothetical protein CR513_42118, partial [Mucuna pruriens]
MKNSLQVLKPCQRNAEILESFLSLGECPFANAMLDLGASIYVMPASIYRSLNFSDLEPTGMTIQLVNKSIVQPLGVLEDVLVQVNELIFPANFYVLDMEDETSGKESTLILGRPFLMTARRKIDVHARMLSMEFAMKHLTEDHSFFGIDLIDELVEEYLQLDNNSGDIVNFAGSTDQISCLGSFIGKADYEEVQDLPNSEDNHNNIADLDFEVELSEMLNQVYNLENPECTNRAEVDVAEIKRPFLAHLATIFMAKIKSAREGRVKEKMKVNLAKKLRSKADTLAEAKPTSEDQKQTRVEFIVPSGSDFEAAQEADADSNSTRIKLINRSRPKQPKVEIMSAHLVSSPNQVGQTDPKSLTEKSSLPSPPMELKPLPNHLKYAYFDKEQQLPVIIANNLYQEQEDKLLEVLRQHKRAIGWKLSDLPGINPSICMHRILMEEEIKPIRQ